MPGNFYSPYFEQSRVNSRLATRRVRRKRNSEIALRRVPGIVPFRYNARTICLILGAGQAIDHRLHVGVLQL